MLSTLHANIETNAKKVYQQDKLVINDSQQKTHLKKRRKLRLAAVGRVFIWNGHYVQWQWTGDLFDLLFDLNQLSNSWQ